MSGDLYLDLGSTSIKWQRGGERETHKTDFPAPFLDCPPRYETDCGQILSVVRNIITKASPARVFFSVQMHGYVLLKGGKAVTGYVSWRDERGAALTPTFSLTEEYGVRIKPNLPRLSLQAQEADGDEFCTLGSFLAYMLTGNNRTHITDAAASGFYNVRKRTRDESVYRLPEAEYGVCSVGRYEGCEIFTPVGDQQAAVLGAADKTELMRNYLLNLGTAGQLCALSESFVCGDFESRPFFGGRTLCTVTGLPGGAYLRAHTENGAPYAAWSAAIEKLPAREGILVCGGAAEYHRERIARALDQTGLPYRFCAGGETMRGLKILSEEEV